MPEQTQRTIEVTGAGAVAAVPDRVTVNIGVESVARTPGLALRQAAEHAQRLVDLVDRHSIPPGDRQTSSLNVAPAYDQRQQREVGHQASYQLTLRLADLDTAGALVDEAAELVGDDLRVGRLSWSVADPLPALAAARGMAIESALERARQLADGLGVTVGPVLRVVEGQDYQAEPRMFVASSPAAPMQAGSQEISCQVRVVFELLDG